jgi:uncharacterized protein (UPF0303 family)
MTNEEIQAKCVEEEQKYQFPSFNQDDAFKLGTMLYQTAQEEFGKPIAIEIRINHLVVFRYLPEGTGANQCIWLKAKADTVDCMRISTYHFWADVACGGRGLKERRLDENKYLCMGGGFPIRIRNSSVVGTICVSAFKHFEDHQVIVDTLEKYFKQL